jgi:5-methylthioadenosine/S-adenosylhomocysteine deaminase
MEVIRRREVKVSHNPVSNLKLASGVSPVREMLLRGITVSLGTDSPCSNNTADMFDLMKTTALLHKGVHRDPTLMPAHKVLEMATIDGARALSWEKEIGSIEVGKKADLVIVDFRKPRLCPLHSETSHLVYAAKPPDVETVMINGDVVLEKGRLTRLNVEKVMKTAEEAKQTLLRKLAQT